MNVPMPGAMETIYYLINLYVLPFWALMILAPNWHGTKRVMGGFWPVAVLPGVYALLLISQLLSPSGMPLDFSLAGIAALPAWAVSPVLFLVLMAGPLGLLLYLILRNWGKGNRHEG